MGVIILLLALPILSPASAPTTAPTSQPAATQPSIYSVLSVDGVAQYRRTEDDPWKRLVPGVELHLGPGAAEHSHDCDHQKPRRHNVTA
jgi:hypothetical protein